MFQRVSNGICFFLLPFSVFPFSNSLLAVIKAVFSPVLFENSPPSLQRRGEKSQKFSFSFSFFASSLGITRIPQNRGIVAAIRNCH